MFCDATSFQICEPLACLQKTNAHNGAIELVNNEVMFTTSPQ